MRDPYQTLGVTKSATADDIKKAYRRLAKELHPDNASGDEERFKEVSAAYAVLSDPAKRGRYDRGEIDAEGNERGPDRRGYKAYSSAKRPGAGGEEEGFSADDFFSDFFGRKRGARPGSAGGGSTAGGSTAGASAGGKTGPKVRGADIAYSVTVAFLEAAQGCKRRINLSNGKSLDVVIPAGAEDQQRLRLKGQGLPGMGGAADGDAIVEVLVEPHPYFRREDGDIHMELPITLPEAILGASIKAPTVSGAVALKVPPGSNSGAVLRLRGKGVPSQQTGKTGDQYVKLKVVLPDPPDSELVQFMERWAQKRSYDVRKKAGLE